MKRRILYHIKKILPKALRHPFNLGLYQGTLPYSVFHKFLSDDEIYLQRFSDVLHKTSTRFKSSQHQTIFQNLADYISMTEKNLHKKYLTVENLEPILLKAKQTRSFHSSPFIRVEHNEIRLSKTPFQFFNSKVDKNILPEVHHYIQHIEEKASLHVAVAKFIPCFAMYSALGRYWKTEGISPQNPYYPWLKSYGGENFFAHTKNILGVADDLAQGLPKKEIEQMVLGIKKSMNYEFKFWSSVLDCQKIQTPQTQDTTPLRSLKQRTQPVNFPIK
jgi:thiaminase